MPDERHGLADEEQPVVAVPEHAKSVPVVEPSRVEERRTGHDASPDAGRRREVARGDAVRDGGFPVKVREVPVKVGTAVARVLDHRREPSRLGLEDLDLPVGSIAGVGQERPALGRVGSLAQPRSVALSGGIVLEKLADLGEGETSIVTKVPDEPQSVEVGRVVEAVVAFGARRRFEQPDLLVVADRAGRQTGLGCDLVDAQESRIDGFGRAGRLCHWARKRYHKVHVHVKVRNRAVNAAAGVSPLHAG